MSNSTISDAERESLFTTRLRLANLPAERIIDVQTAPAVPLRLAALAREAGSDPTAIHEGVVAFLKAVNELCDGVLRKQGRVNLSAVQAAEDGFEVLADRLGVDLNNPATWLRTLRDTRAEQRKLDVPAVEAALEARATARAAKDFDTADRLQRELLAQGVVLVDHAHGSDWTLTST